MIGLVVVLVVALAASITINIMFADEFGGPRVQGSGWGRGRDRIDLRDYTVSELFARSVEYTERALKARDEYERSNKTYGIQFTSKHLKHYRRLQAEVRRTNRELRRRGAEEYAHQ